MNSEKSLSLYTHTHIQKLRQEKVQLEHTLEQEQEQRISKLTKRIERLEKDTLAKQTSLEQVSTKGHSSMWFDLPDGLYR